MMDPMPHFTGPSLEEQLDAAKFQKETLSTFEFGRAFAATKDSASGQMLAQFMELGWLSQSISNIELTPLGRYEHSRLGHVIKDIEARIEERDKAEAERTALVAEREAELNAKHSDWKQEAINATAGTEHDENL